MYLYGLGYRNWDGWNRAERESTRIYVRWSSGGYLHEKEYESLFERGGRTCAWTPCVKSLGIYNGGLGGDSWGF